MLCRNSAKQQLLYIDACFARHWTSVNGLFWDCWDWEGNNWSQDLCALFVVLRGQSNPIWMQWEHTGSLVTLCGSQTALQLLPIIPALMLSISWFLGSLLTPHWPSVRQSEWKHKRVQWKHQYNISFKTNNTLLNPSNKCSLSYSVSFPMWIFKFSLVQLIGSHLKDCSIYYPPITV